MPSLVQQTLVHQIIDSKRTDSAVILLVNVNLLESKHTTMPTLSGNSIKFLVGSLVGAVLMMLSDMNDMLVQMEKESLMSSAEPTMIPITLQNLNTSLYTEGTAAPLVGERNIYLEKMKRDFSMTKSLSQFTSLWRKKDYLSDNFDRQRRFDTDPGEYGAAVVSDEFAFLHIWANADRTVMKAIESNLKEEQRRKDVWEIKKRKWFALVQDPVQHFLAGWAMAELKILEEVRARGHHDLASKIMASWEAPDKTYDDRVAEFLDRVIKYSSNAATAEISPLMHALPQTNFLLDDVGMIDPNLVVIGDVSEWDALLELAGYPGDISKVEVDPPSTVESKYFPSEPNRLSRGTLLRLCDFLAMDYYLLSYDAPSSCLKRDGPLDFSRRRILLQEQEDD